MRIKFAHGAPRLQRTRFVTPVLVTGVPAACSVGMFTQAVVLQFITKWLAEVPYKGAGWYWCLLSLLALALQQLLEEDARSCKVIHKLRDRAK